jgi:hypothetical protein
MQVVPESDAFVQGLREELLLQPHIFLGPPPYIAFAGEFLALRD